MNRRLTVLTNCRNCRLLAGSFTTTLHSSWYVPTKASISFSSSSQIPSSSSNKIFLSLYKRSWLNQKRDGHVTNLGSPLKLLNPTSGTHEPVGCADIIHKKTVKDPHDLGWRDIFCKQGGVPRIGTAISGQEYCTQGKLGSCYNE